MGVADYIVKNFTKGVVSRVEKESLPKGAASSSLNWLTLGDRIELRRGQAVMGTPESGVGRISGLIVGTRFDGVQVPICARGRKIKAYNRTTLDWVETSVPDILPVEADDEDISFAQYHSLAGAMVYGSSPNSSFYKIMLANPTDAIDMAMKNHRGKIRIKQNRTFLWDRKDTNGGSDKTGLYGSYIDKDELSDYTEIVAETVGTGDGTTRTFSYTLVMAKTSRTITSDATDVVSSTAHGFSNGDPIKFSTTGTLPAGLVAGQAYFVVNATTDTFKVSLVPSGAPVDITDTGSGVHTATNNIRRTVMYVRVTDGIETFSDDRNGSLTGSAGGTGTVNYATGAISVTFAVAPTNGTTITSSYYREDSFSTGICDFSKSTPRTAGQGFTFRQDDGGVDFQNMGTIGGDEFCLHKLKTWKLTLSGDDTNATNPIYRNKVGIPNWRAMVETGDGIYYIDDTDANNPFVRLLQLNSISTEVIPRSISDNIDLSNYRFDKSVMAEWGLYIIVSCRTSDSTINNRTLFYHKLWKSWDVTDFRVSALEEYGGVLLGGDSGSNNVYTLFDGFADEDSLIPNNWISGKSNLDYEGIKRFTVFVMAGLISIDQVIKVYFSYDGADFVEVGEILGNGDYVDFDNQVTIGSHMVGEQEIGGESAPGSIQASPYRREFTVQTSIFEYLRIKFEATSIGFASVSEYQCKDVRYKGKKLPSQYAR